MSELFVPTVNFLMLVGLLGYFVWPPFKKSVAQRQEDIKKLAEDARTQKVEAEKRLREFESKLRAFEADAEGLLRSAQTDAEALRVKIVDDARKQAEHIRNDAESTASSNVTDFRNELKREVVKQAVAQAEKIIRDSLSKDAQSKIIRDYMEKVV
jgi:F-type H+-transporting ATPase subunit b